MNNDTDNDSIEKNDTDKNCIAKNDTAIPPTDVSLVTDRAPVSAERAAETERWFRMLTARQQIYLRSSAWDGKSDSLIALELKCSSDDVRDFVIQRKWREKAVADADEKKKNSAIVDAWRQSVSIKAQDVSLSALQIADDAARIGDSKSLANAARGAASLVSLVRQAEGMDRRDSDAPSQINLSVFFMPAPGEESLVFSQSEAIDVTPDKDLF